MTQPIISVENLGKSYLVGHFAQGMHQYDSFRDATARAMRDFGRKALDMARGRQIIQGDEIEEFWALKDVSFEVNQGEVVGIIGRNGAGKSTLLKVLSRITEPTKGSVTLRGRVASLLEVGTGFHPELTGRENVFLNGAILGMNRGEIKSKFDEIVDFANVEKFLDTPVKRYSSGMSVRLAFSVAAHLEPEILVIDEVLAVGDARFQKKCLGKMQEISGHGRTVLFVSHNMGMITSLCPSAILLDHGEIVARGTAPEMVGLYIGRGNSAQYAADFRQPGRGSGDHLARLLEAHVEDVEGKPTGEIDIRAPVKIKMRYELHQRVSNPPYANFHFFDARGECAFISNGRDYIACSGMEPGVYEAACVVPAELLNNGTYFVGLALTFTHQGLHVSFFEKDALSITVVDPLEETLDGSRCGYSGPIPGLVRPRLEWSIRKES